ncbi:hypothetical protein CathTA2_1614 [Caldalkalibacillus thermarum TA2.A1]|uniref:DUF2768 family protein n=1 Tax=Caldalkalibacillus thermarum (strain TA2.A1) TaxID=986075 RepID=F5L714_CALTT|nr:DUF2768 family protein [Caldalkalibacillus thermarum]EGL82849.1 hypothetical protein CathTA2_1614 [Caldalkalibacillus thermarum TA2.A1]QZT32703.1 DUF2768 family protein [Caldalkalibacillus thermarum TA2.A1]GGK24958.1 hypothetical protein GCM10010965_17140 [Caldalkalibacillus thermarum]
MDPLTKMLIALLAMITMFIANISILTARKKLKGFFKFLLSVFAYLLLGLSLLMIVVVIFSI